MKIELEINDCITENIIKADLLNSYRHLNDDISLYYDKYENDDAPKYVKQDLMDNIKYRDALEIVLKYYLSTEEFEKEVLEDGD